MELDSGEEEKRPLDSELRPFSQKVSDVEASDPGRSIRSKHAQRLHPYNLCYLIKGQAIQASWYQSVPQGFETCSAHDLSFYVKDSHVLVKPTVTQQIGHL
jgi:hypothetical protein